MISLRKRIFAFTFLLMMAAFAVCGYQLLRVQWVQESWSWLSDIEHPLSRELNALLLDGNSLIQQKKIQEHWLMERIEQRHARIEMWLKDSPNEKWREWILGAKSRLSEVRTQQVFRAQRAALEQWLGFVEWAQQDLEREKITKVQETDQGLIALKQSLRLSLFLMLLYTLVWVWSLDRALRPLAQLKKIVKQVAEGGLRKSDRAQTPDLMLARDDEVSELSREFHRMAVTVLEREKTVDTQRRRLEEQNRQLREISDLNENILKSIKSPLLVCDRFQHVFAANPSALRFLELPLEMVIGKKFEEIERLKDIPQLLETVEVVIGLGERQRLRAMKKERVFDGEVLPFMNEAGPAQGVVLLFHDITEEVALQDRLRISENFAAVGRMSAQVAHEVRNPLHAIGLETEMALSLLEKQRTTELQGPLESILAGVERLEQLTENYLKLSRLSPNERKHIDIQEILERVIVTYSSSCQSKRILVNWSTQGVAPFVVRGDPLLLEQALGNLMKNAIQALEDTQNDKKIEWTLEKTEQNLILVRITDNGPGLAKEVREKLFTPFITTRAEGTGLGLSFIKKVIEDHQGSIRAVSEVPQNGAIFEISMQSAQLKGVELNA